MGWVPIPTIAVDFPAIAVDFPVIVVNLKCLKQSLSTRCSGGLLTIAGEAACQNGQQPATAGCNSALNQLLDVVAGCLPVVTGGLPAITSCPNRNSIA